MSGIYAVTSQALLSGAFNWTTGSFGVMLIGPGYTPNFATDATLASVPAAAQLLAAPVVLTGEAVSNGFCSAANVSWTGLTTAAAIEAILIVENTGTAEAPVWTLVCLIDQGDGFGQQASGGPVSIVFDARGVFQP